MGWLKGWCRVRGARKVLVLRKGRLAFWQKLGTLSASSVLLYLLLVQESLEGAAPALFALWAVGVVLLEHDVQRSKITLTEHEIILKGKFRRRRRSLAHAASLVRVAIAPLPGSTGVIIDHSPAEVLFVLDAHGSELFQVNCEGFKTSDLDRLVDALGLPCDDGPGEPLTLAKFGKMRPDLVPWADRHPYLIVSALIFLFVVFFVGFLLITA
ncbi:hypothetical protein OHR68_31140 [Spirillospora sp. NBC_00431]